MSSLTGKTPSATYKSLLKIDGANQEVDGTERIISDGSGNPTALKLALTTASVTGTFNVIGGMGVTEGVTFSDDLDIDSGGSINIDNGSLTVGGSAQFNDGVTITGNTAVTGNVTGTNLNIANWDTAYGWGDHSAEIDGDIATHTALASAHHTKYALTEDLASTEITALQNINTETITNTQWGYLGAMGGQPLETFSESDPVFVAHQANNISAQMITDLGNLSNINSGDQVLPTDFVSKASGGTFDDEVEVTFSEYSPTGDYKFLHRGQFLQVFTHNIESLNMSAGDYYPIPWQDDASANYGSGGMSSGTSVQSSKRFLCPYSGMRLVKIVAKPQDNTFTSYPAILTFKFGYRYADVDGRTANPNNTDDGSWTIETNALAPEGVGHQPALVKTYDIDDGGVGAGSITTIQGLTERMECIIQFSSDTTLNSANGWQITTVWACSL